MMRACCQATTALLLALVASSHAAVFDVVNWESPVNGLWKQGAKWDVRRPPCYDETASFPDSDERYDVLIDKEAAKAVELGINSFIVFDQPGSTLYIGANEPDEDITACVALAVQLEVVAAFAVKVTWAGASDTTYHVTTSEGFETTTTRNWILVPTLMDQHMSITVAIGTDGRGYNETIDYYFSSVNTATWELPVDGEYANASYWENDAVPCPNKHIIFPDATEDGNNQDYEVTLADDEERDVLSLSLMPGSSIVFGFESGFNLGPAEEDEADESPCPTMTNPRIEIVSFGTVLVSWDSIEGDAETVIVEVMSEDDAVVHTFNIEDVSVAKMAQVPNLESEQTYTIRVFLGEEQQGGLHPRHAQLFETVTMPSVVSWRSNSDGEFDDTSKWFYRQAPMLRLPCPTEHVDLRRRTDNGPDTLSVALDSVAEFRSISFSEPGVRLTFDAPGAGFFLLSESEAEQALQGQDCTLDDLTTSTTTTTTTSTTTSTTTTTTTSTTTSTTTTSTTSTTTTTSTTSTTLPREVATARLVVNLGSAFFDSADNRQSFADSMARVINENIAPFQVFGVALTNYQSGNRRRSTANTIIDVEVEVEDIDTANGTLFEDVFCNIRDLTAPDRANPLAEGVSGDLGVPMELTLLALEGCDDCVCPDQQLTCPPGTRQANNTCIVTLCFANETETADNGCRDENGNVRYPGCPPGSTLVEVGNGVTQCRLQPQCASSTLIYDEEQQICVPRIVGCPSGFIKNVHGDCVLEYVFCGPGQAYDPDIKTGPGVSPCVDIDECAEGTDLCDPSATCTNQLATYTCTCPEDTFGDGRTDGTGCFDPCDPSPCVFNETCSVLVIGIAQCSCPNPLFGDGRIDGSGCINPCDSSPCVAGAGCTAQPGGAFTCQCPSNTYGDGRVLGNGCVNPCDADPCVDNAACDASGRNDFTCECPTGFSGNGRKSGSGCVNPCEPNPCKFGGSCSVSTNSDGFSCSCNAPYTGPNCQLDSSACDAAPCDNGATCVAGIASPDGDHSKANFTCECAAGFSGDSCGTVLATGNTDDDQTSMIIIIAAAAGGGLLLIVIILVVVMARRRHADDLGLKDIGSDPFEIDRKRVRLADKLGSGAFGEVFKAFLRPPPSDPTGAERLVAAKLLKAGAPVEEKKDFLSEINLMKQLGPHPNVVGIIGHCLSDEPFILLVELAEKGNLRDFLRDARKNQKHPQLLHFADFADFSLQIASGMAFLESNNVVHRDLACRNVLVGKGNNLKISDFGLARDVEGENYYRKKTTGKLPIKWMAPESLQDRIFTNKSDVWSYGVTMWEIFTLGGSPYPTLQNHEVLEHLEGNQRMKKPRQCNNEFYDIMMSCWRWDAFDRPSFAELVTTVNAAKNRGNYLEPTSSAESDDVYEMIARGDDVDGLGRATKRKSAAGVADWMESEMVNNPMVETNIDGEFYDNVDRTDPTYEVADRTAFNKAYSSDVSGQTYDSVDNSGAVSNSVIYELAGDGGASTVSATDRGNDEVIYDMAESNPSQPRSVSAHNTGTRAISRRNDDDSAIYELGDLGAVNSLHRRGQNIDYDRIPLPSEVIYDLADVDQLDGELDV